MDSKKEQSIKEILKVVILYADELPIGTCIPSLWQPPKGFLNEKLMVDKIPVEHLIPKNKKTERIVLQFHGGAYLLAFMDSCRDGAVKYSDMAGGAEVYSVDYRVAPKDHYPAALEDAVAVYEWLLNKGYDNNNILIIGDSAGGNLALALVLYLKDNNIPLPKSVIVLSPWTNAANDFPSIKFNYEKDSILGKYGVKVGNQLKKSLYFESANVKKDPYASPVLGNYVGFPNLLIQAGAYEILLDDAKKVAEKAKAANVNVKLTVYDEMPHDFQMVFFDIEETINAWKEMQKFVEENM